MSLSVTEHSGRESAIRQCYADWRAAQPALQAITLLSIAPREVLIASGDGAEPDQVFVLELGWQTLSESFFHHQPPSALELEEAIVPVEDQLAKARQLAGNGARLCSSDDVLLMVARAIAGDQPLPLSVSRLAIEQAFEDLSMLALGQRPLRFGQALPTGQFVAVLLILRELLHHLQFDALTLGQWGGGECSFDACLMV